MLLECEQCHSRFNLDDRLLAEEGSRVRCSICRHTFTVYPSEPAPLEGPAIQEQAEEVLEETVALATPVEEGQEAAHGEDAGEEGFERAFRESFDEEFETVPLDEMPEPDQEEEEAGEEEAAIPSGAVAEEHRPGAAAVREGMEAVGPAHPEKTPGRPKFLLIALLLLVLILGGGVAVFFFAPQFIPDSLSVLKPPARQEITDLGVRRLSFREVNGLFVRSDKAGQLFVVRGKVSNNYPKGRSFIFIKGSLLDDKGQVVQTSLIYAGNALADEQMKDMSLEEINEGLKNQYGKGRMNVNVQPDATIPFMIVFGNLPDNLSEFTVEAVKSSPAE